MQNKTKTMLWGRPFHSISLYPAGLKNIIRAVVVSLLLVFSVEGIAQSPSTTYPGISVSSCTSKDLELVAAFLEGSDSCSPAVGNKKLFLKINNKTGSTRTSFAFWGYLYKNSDAPQLIYACVGPVPPNQITTLESNSSINYQIGDKLVIKSLFLAWTSASPGQTCEVLAANPNGIAPKCGTLDSLVILTPVGANTSSSRATCPTNNGSLTVTPLGGRAPYKIAIYKSGTKIDSVGSVSGSRTFSDLAAGTYTIYAFDARNCSYATTETIQSPVQPAAPTLCKTEPTLCGSANGTVVVTDSAANYTYFAITNSGTIDNGTRATFSLPGGSNPRIFYKCGTVSPACISDTTDCPTVSCPAPSVAAEQAVKTQDALKSEEKQKLNKLNALGAGTLESSVTIKAVPNPFGNKVRFMITMEEAGNGVLEIYNIQGQKIKTVFQGYVPAGTNFYDLTVPSHRRAELIYIFRKGTEQFSGKLLQLDKN